MQSKKKECFNCYILDPSLNKSYKCKCRGTCPYYLTQKQKDAILNLTQKQKDGILKRNMEAHSED